MRYYLRRSSLELDLCAKVELFKLFVILHGLVIIIHGRLLFISLCFILACFDDTLLWIRKTVENI